MVTPSLAVMRRSVQFFRDGLGLTVNVASETFAEVNAGPITIALKASDRCTSSLFAPCTFFSPLPHGCKFLLVHVLTRRLSFLQLVDLHGRIFPDAPV